MSIFQSGISDMISFDLRFSNISFMFTILRFSYSTILRPPPPSIFMQPPDFFIRFGQFYIKFEYKYHFIPMTERKKLIVFEVFESVNLYLGMRSEIREKLNNKRIALKVKS